MRVATTDPDFMRQSFESLYGEAVEGEVGRHIDNLMPPDPKWLFLSIAGIRRVDQPAIHPFPEHAVIGHHGG